jgi:hypothetical protein
MQIEIPKSYMPRLKFSGTPKELDHFLKRPQRMVAIATHATNTSMYDVLPKVTAAIMHSLNILTWSAKENIRIVESRTTTPTRTRIVFQLSQHAWEEAFGQRASDKWNAAVSRLKRYKERIKKRAELERKRAAARRRRQKEWSDRMSGKSGATSSGGVLKDILVECVFDPATMKVRVKPTHTHSGRVNTTYWVKFPTKLRLEGKQYMVDGLKLSNNHYVVVGNIYNVGLRFTKTKAVG